MKTKLLILLLILPLFLKAQKEDFLPPIIVPPSPTAYELGKYGFNDAGLFTGSAELNIPLYQYTSGKLNLPISLSYRSNGIKVDQLSSNVGLGWSLNAGGIITRIVRGKSDENNQILFPKGDISEYGVRSPMSVKFFYEAGNYNVDSEPDIYAYNFGGYSGRFVYTKEKELILMSHNDLKIVPYSQDLFDGFKIYTPNGNQYFFLEVEETHNRSAGSGWYEPGLPDRTSWYLSKIVHPNGDTIEFIYDSEAYTYVVSVSESIKIPTSSYQRIGCNTYTSPGDYKIDSVSNRLTVASKRLKQIKSSINEKNGTVDFSYIYDHPSSEVSSSYAMLSGFSIKNEELDTIEKIDIEYLFTNNDRPFLSKIEFKDSTKSYEFDYINPESFPKRLDFGQDHWGFNNGKNNSYKFPNPNLMGNYLIPGEFRNFNIGADREIDTTEAVKGLLSRVTFPTGGFQEFDYESNNYEGTRKVYPASETKYLSVETDFDNMVDEMTITLTNISADQKVNFYKSIIFNEYLSECGDINSYPPHHILATISVKKILSPNDATIFETTTLGEVSIGNSINITPENLYSTAFIQLEKNNDYEVKLKVIRSCLVAYMNLTYFKGSIQEVVDNINIGGSRVKRISIFDPLSNKTEYKRYYYGKKDALNVSSGQSGVTPFYVTNDEDSFSGDCNFNQGIIAEFIGNYKLLNSSSVRTLYETSIGTTSYEYVTISHGGDNFENGGEEHKFKIGTDYPGNPIWGEYDQSVPWTNAGWTNGLEEYSNYFKKDVGTNSFITLKVATHSYKLDERNYDELKSYAVRKKYNRLGPEGNLFYKCTSDDITKTFTYTVCQTDHHHKYQNNYQYRNINGVPQWIRLVPIWPDYVRICIKNDANQLLINKKHDCYDQGMAVNDSVVMSLDKIRNLDITEYENRSYWHYLDSTTVKQYDTQGLNPVTTTTAYFYDNQEHVQLSRTVMTDSKGNTVESEMYYPDDVSSLSDLPGGNITLPDLNAIDSLKARYRINTVLQRDQTNNGSLFRTRTIFKDWGQLNGSANHVIEPKMISSSKGSTSLVDRVEFEDYDDHGNLIEVRKKQGASTYYVWGYDNSKPIAKIDNVGTITTVQQTAIDNATAFADSDLDESTENTLRTKLELLRDAFPDAFVTTYTYDPLIGVTSITDPIGYTTYYDYDTNNRLRYIKNKDQKVIKSFDYNYKQIIPSYAITSTTNGNGTVGFSATDVDEGGSVNVTVAPDSGYQISSITVNGTSQSISSSFTLTNITSNTVVDVQFSVIPPSLAISPTSMTFDWIDGTKTVTVTSSGSWTVSKSQSWITISATSGSGNGSFTIRPNKNTGSERYGTVTVSQSGTNKTVYINQSASDF